MNLFDDPKEAAMTHLVLTAAFAHGMLSANKAGGMTVSEAKLILDDAETMAEVLVQRIEAMVARVK